MTAHASDPCRAASGTYGTYGTYGREAGTPGAYGRETVTPGADSKKRTFPRLLRGEEGNAYVKTAVSLILFCMLLSGVLFFAEMMSTVRAVKRRAVSALDGCVILESVVIYGELDDGSDLIQAPDPVIFARLFAAQFSSLEEDGDRDVFVKRRSGAGGEGEEEFAVTKPRLSLDGSGHLRPAAEFDVIFPVRFAGRTLFEARVPVSVKGRFVNKYS